MIPFRPSKISAVIFTAFTAAILLTGCSAAAGAKNSDQENGTEWFNDSFDSGKMAAYDAFRAGAERPFDSEPIPIKDKTGTVIEISVSDLAEAYQGFLYDHPEVFWLSSSYNYRVSGNKGGEEMADAVSVIPVAGDEDELDAMKREFESAAEDYLQIVSDVKGDKEKAKILYDGLADVIEYEEEALYDSTLKKEHTAYGAVVCRKAVCDGVALAYKYLLSECGIRCIVIPGESEGTAHVWNTVYWDDSWHEADLTWDTASEGNDSMQYFDLSTEEMNKDHSREKEGIALAIPRSSERSD